MHPRDGNLVSPLVVVLLVLHRASRPQDCERLTHDPGLGTEQQLKNPQDEVDHSDRAEQRSVDKCHVQAPRERDRLAYPADLAVSE